MAIIVCNLCHQLESDDVSELNDSVQQSSDSCAVHEIQKVSHVIFIFIIFCVSVLSSVLCCC